MFAPSHPLTHTQNLQRTYTSQTTSKKNTNKENANALPSKTPSRAGPSKLVPSTSVRIGLGVKTVERNANANALGAQLGTGKGKGAEGKDIEPKRLFQSTIQSTSKAQIPPSRSLSSLPTLQPRQPNTHKTPLPSRRLPPSASRNLLRTPAPGPAIPPSPTPLPSASRTRRRSRQSLTPLRASASDQSFVTPLPSGRWEEDASLDSIVEDAEKLDIGLDGVAEVEEEGSEDEIEYMPPRAVELPWEPSWDHPDLKPIMETIMRLPLMWIPHDDQEAIVVDEPDWKGEEAVPRIRLSSDDDLEEPMFRRKPPPTQPASKPVLISQPSAIRPVGPTAKAPIIKAASSGPPARKPTSTLSSHAKPSVPPGARRPVPLSSNNTIRKSAVPDAPISAPSRAPVRSAISAKQAGFPSMQTPKEKKSESVDPILLDIPDELLGMEDFAFDLDSVDQP